MDSTVSVVVERVTVIKEEITSYGNKGGSTDSASAYDEGDIGEESPLLPTAKKKAEPDSTGLAAILAKLFGLAGMAAPPTMQTLLAPTDQKTPLLPQFTDPAGKSDNSTTTPVSYTQPAPTEQVAEVKAEPEPEPPMPSEKTGKPVEGEQRPEGDTRSAEQIINDNPALKNLGNQKDIQRDELKERCGDWTEANPDPKSRADAAWKMAHVLNWIDNSKTANGKDIKAAGNGDISGITKDGDARHGTKAGLFKDFGDKGYEAIKNDQRLDKTNDSHVREDGTNKDNFQWACGQAGKVLKYIIPGLGNVLEGIGNSRGGFEGVLKGAFGGVFETWRNNLDGLVESIKTGRLSPMQILANMYKANVEDAAKDDAKLEAKNEYKDYKGDKKAQEEQAAV